MMRGIVCLAIVAAAAPAVRAADLYRVAGVVVNAATGAPLPRARVILMRSGTPDVAGATIAGDDGRFSFDVPAGKFSMSAGTRDAGGVFGARNPDVPIGTAIVTGPGQNTTGLVFRGTRASPSPDASSTIAASPWNPPWCNSSGRA